MARIPVEVGETLLSGELKRQGLSRRSQGKVRDIYELPGFPDLMLVIATDRLSIFDIVLNTLVPFKGAVLNALTVYWTKLFPDVLNDIKAFGALVDAYLPAPLQENREIQTRGLVVRKCRMFKAECVVRGYLTGSGWRDYQQTGKVCGHKLSPRLHDGSCLPEPIFTPATKAETGHDQNISFEELIPLAGGYRTAVNLRDLSLLLYKRALRYSLQCGIILADTKFEFGMGPYDQIMLCDERLTPDSSRLWKKDHWDAAVLEKKSPSGYDKEPVRQWGNSLTTPFGVAFSKLDPDNLEHVVWVHSLTIPREVVEPMTNRCIEIARILTGKPLARFQERDMGVRAD